MTSKDNTEYTLDRLAEAHTSDKRLETEMFTLGGERILILFEKVASPGATGSPGGQEPKLKSQYEILSVWDLLRNIHYNFPEPITQDNKKNIFLVQIKPPNLNVIVTEVEINQNCKFSKNLPNFELNKIPPDSSIFRQRYPRFDRMYLEYEGILQGSRRAMDRIPSTEAASPNSLRSQPTSTRRSTLGMPEIDGPKQSLALNWNKEVTIVDYNLGQLPLLNQSVRGADKVNINQTDLVPHKTSLTVKGNGEVLYMSENQTFDQANKVVVKTKYKMLTEHGDVILSDWQSIAEASNQEATDRVTIFYNTGELYKGQFKKGMRSDRGCHQAFKISTNVAEIDYIQRLLYGLGEIVADLAQDQLTKQENWYKRFSLNTGRFCNLEADICKMKHFHEVLSGEGFREMFVNAERWTDDSTEDSADDLAKLISQGRHYLFENPSDYLDKFCAAIHNIIEDLRRVSIKKIFTFWEMRARIIEEMRRVADSPELENQVDDLLMYLMFWENPADVGRNLSVFFQLSAPNAAEIIQKKFKELAVLRLRVPEQIYNLFSQKFATQFDEFRDKIEVLKKKAEQEENNSGNNQANITGQGNASYELASKFKFFFFRYRPDGDSGRSHNYFLTMLKRNAANEIKSNVALPLISSHERAREIISAIQIKPILWDSSKMAQLLREIKDKLLSQSVLNLNELEYMYLMATNEQLMLTKELEMEEGLTAAKALTKLSKEKNQLEDIEEHTKLYQKIKTENIEARLKSRADFGKNNESGEKRVDILGSLDDRFVPSLPKRAEPVDTKELKPKSEFSFREIVKEEKNVEEKVAEEPGVVVKKGNKEEKIPISNPAARVALEEILATDPSDNKPPTKLRDAMSMAIMAEADMDYGDEFREELSMALRLTAQIRWSLKTNFSNGNQELLKNWEPTEEMIKAKPDLFKPTNPWEAPNKNCLQRDIEILEIIFKIRTKLKEQAKEKLAIKATQRERLHKALLVVSNIKDRVVARANQILKSAIDQIIEDEMETFSSSNGLLDKAFDLTDALKDAGKRFQVKEDTVLPNPEDYKAQAVAPLTWTDLHSLPKRASDYLLESLFSHFNNLISTEIGRHQGKSAKSLQKSDQQLQIAASDQGQFILFLRWKYDRKTDPQCEKDFDERLETYCNSLVAEQANILIEELNRKFDQEVAELTTLKQQVLGSVNFSILESKFLASAIDLEIQLLLKFLSRKVALSPDEIFGAEKTSAVYLSEVQLSQLRKFLENPSDKNSLERINISRERQKLLIKYLDLNVITDDLHRKSTLKTIDYLLKNSLKPILATDEIVQEVFRIDETFLRASLHHSGHLVSQKEVKDIRAIESLRSLLDRVGRNDESVKETIAALSTKIRQTVLQKVENYLTNRLEVWQTIKSQMDLDNVTPEISRALAENISDMLTLFKQESMRRYEFMGNLKEEAAHNFNEMTKFERREFDFYREYLWSSNCFPEPDQNLVDFRENFHMFTPDYYSWKLFFNKSAEPIRRMLAAKEIRDIQPDINEDGMIDNAANWKATHQPDHSGDAAGGKEALAQPTSAAEDDAAGSEKEGEDLFSYQKIEEKHIQSEMETILQKFAYEKVKDIVRYEIHKKLLREIYPHSYMLPMDQFHRIVIDVGLVTRCNLQVGMAAVGNFKQNQIEFGMRVSDDGAVYLGNFKADLYNGLGMLFVPLCSASQAEFKFAIRDSKDFRTEQEISLEKLAYYFGRKNESSKEARPKIGTLIIRRKDKNFQKETNWLRREWDKIKPKESGVEGEAPGPVSPSSTAWKCPLFQTRDQQRQISFWEKLTSNRSRESLVNSNLPLLASDLDIGIDQVIVEFPFTCYKGEFEKGDFLYFKPGPEDQVDDGDDQVSSDDEDMDIDPHSENFKLFQGQYPNNYRKFEEGMSPLERQLSQGMGNQVWDDLHQNSMNNLSEKKVIGAVEQESHFHQETEEGNLR